MHFIPIKKEQNYRLPVLQSIWNVLTSVFASSALLHLFSIFHIKLCNFVDRRICKNIFCSRVQGNGTLAMPLWSIVGRKRYWTYQHIQHLSINRLRGSAYSMAIKLASVLMSLSCLTYPIHTQIVLRWWFDSFEMLVDVLYLWSRC